MYARQRPSWPPTVLKSICHTWLRTYTETSDSIGCRAVENLSTHMMALQFQRHRGLRLVNCEIPTITDDQVLIRVEYAGICGRDLHILQETSRYSDRVILGHEAIGHVVSRGRRVPERLGLGDAVVLHPQFTCGECPRCRKGQPNFCEKGGYSSTMGYWHDGCFAEYCAAQYSQFYSVPQQLPFKAALFC